jgi:hypothetical protein
MTEEPNDKYPRDGKEINCWYCESEGRKNSDYETLIPIRVAQSARFICIPHLIKTLIVDMAQNIMKKAHGEWWNV